MKIQMLDSKLNERKKPPLSLVLRFITKEQNHYRARGCAKLQGIHTSVSEFHMKT